MADTIKVKITQQYGGYPKVTDLETGKEIEGVYRYEISRSVKEAGCVILFLHAHHIAFDIETDAETKEG